MHDDALLTKKECAELELGMIRHYLAQYRYELHVEKVNRRKLYYITYTYFDSATDNEVCVTFATFTQMFHVKLFLFGLYSGSGDSELVREFVGMHPRYSIQG